MVDMPPVMDQVDNVVFCRRCGGRLGVVATALAGLIPPITPHTGGCPVPDTDTDDSAAWTVL